MFTVKKPLKLIDGESTANNIENVKKIKEAGYNLKSIDFTYNKKKGVYSLEGIFSRPGEDEEKKEFSGFSIGYGGEGPHGFKEFCKIFDVSIDKKIDVNTFDLNNKPHMRLWPLEEIIDGSAEIPESGNFFFRASDDGNIKVASLESLWNRNNK